MSLIANFAHDGVITVNRVVLKSGFSIDDLQERVAL
ncbi:MAG: ligand-binding protein SH3, partial [Gammaproteobacteria bacterium]|nr:ligand-binding protein SH3 [Gammaproteobacteria bacterium]